MTTPRTTARHSWVPYVAAAAGTALLFKGSLAAWRGEDTPDTAMAALYLGGILLGVVAAVGLGLRQRGLLRGLAVGGGPALLLVFWIMGLGEALEPVVALLTDVRHTQEEVPIAVAGLGLLVLAWLTWTHDAGARSERTPAVV